MPDENGKLIREMHGDIKVLIFKVEKVSEQVLVQNGHIQSLNKFKIQVQAIFALMSFIAAIGGGTLLAFLLGYA